MPKLPWWFASGLKVRGYKKNVAGAGPILTITEVNEYEFIYVSSDDQYPVTRSWSDMQTRMDPEEGMIDRAFNKKWIVKYPELNPDLDD